MVVDGKRVKERISTYAVKREYDEETNITHATTMNTEYKKKRKKKNMMR